MLKPPDRIESDTDAPRKASLLLEAVDRGSGTARQIANCTETQKYCAVLHGYAYLFMTMWAQHRGRGGYGQGQ